MECSGSSDVLLHDTTPECDERVLAAGVVNQDRASALPIDARVAFRNGCLGNLQERSVSSALTAAARDRKSRQACGSLMRRRTRLSVVVACVIDRDITRANVGVDRRSIAGNDASDINVLGDVLESSLQEC